MDGFWFFLHTHSPDFIPFPLLYVTNSIDGIHSSEETMGLFVFFFGAKGGFERGMLEDGWEEFGGGGVIQRVSCSSQPELSIFIVYITVLI